jgi:hypothetical protein
LSFKKQGENYVLTNELKKQLMGFGGMWFNQVWFTKTCLVNDEVHVIGVLKGFFFLNLKI